MVEASKMGLAFQLTIGGQRWVEKHFHLEGATRSRAAGASPTVYRRQNLFWICRKSAVSSRDQKICLQGERGAIDDMQLRHAELDFNAKTRSVNIASEQMTGPW